MSAEKRRCSSTAGIGDAIRPTEQSDGRSAQTNERAASFRIVARLLFGSAGESSTSLRASRAFGSPPTKRCGRPPDHGCRPRTARCVRSDQGEGRVSSREKTPPETPRRTEEKTAGPRRALPASPDGKRPHRIGPVRVRDLRRRTSRRCARRSDSRRSKPSPSAPSRARLR